ncbi:hypothetical protein [Frondihabitans sp. PAMC 28766]|uniref:hypothetical protein n=1 Tax=Frondihabitans sp. PAMC 28766 TaxID=1795630 RepID=UPI0012FFA7C0|nr:hypothetical protein [Frondihabitans sp. PAMC 28766]
MNTTDVDTRGAGVFSRQYLLSTVGMVVLIGIAAFESLAVTTVMPTISRELRGEALYSLSFAAPSRRASSAWSSPATGPTARGRAPS